MTDSDKYEDQDGSVIGAVGAPIVIRLAGAPVAKGRPRGTIIAGRPVFYTPAATRKHEAVLRLAASQAMNGRPPLTGPLRVIITVWLPIPRSWSKRRHRMALCGVIGATKRPDIDNYAKAAVDGLNTVVFRDDSQITDLIVRKRYADVPALVIEVEPVEADAA